MPKTIFSHPRKPSRRVVLVLPAVALAALAGCGHGQGPAPSGCGGAPLAPGDHMFSLQFGGMTRTYILYVPTGYDDAIPTPLVVNFHGWLSSGMQQEMSSEMDPTADADGFMAAYPDGVSHSWNGGSCCPIANDPNNPVDDVGFAKALVRDIGARSCMDPHRVFATGMSNGGVMTNRLACQAADVFAAFAPVAGGLGIPADQCNPGRPVPIVHFHGTADPLAPYDGGTTSPGVVAMMQGWAARDGCDATSTETFVNGAAHCDTWPNCNDGVEVTLCTVDGMGHCWPGSATDDAICTSLGIGPGSLDISANDRMWQLFMKSPLP